LSNDAKSGFVGIATIDVAPDRYNVVSIKYLKAFYERKQHNIQQTTLPSVDPELIDARLMNDNYLPQRHDEVPQIHTKQRRSRNTNKSVFELLQEGLNSMLQKLKENDSAPSGAYQSGIIALIDGYVRNTGYRKNLSKQIRIAKNTKALIRVLQRWMNDFHDMFANRLKKY
jgi:hypothetical protein